MFNLLVRVRCTSFPEIRVMCLLTFRTTFTLHYSGLRSPGQSNSTYFWNDSWVQTFRSIYQHLLSCFVLNTPPVFAVSRARSSEICIFSQNHYRQMIRGSMLTWTGGAVQILVTCFASSLSFVPSFHPFLSSYFFLEFFSYEKVGDCIPAIALSLKIPTRVIIFRLYTSK